MRFESVARVTVIGVDVYMYISFKRFVCYSAFSPASNISLVRFDPISSVVSLKTNISQTPISAFSPAR